MREPEKKMLPIGDVQSERVRARRKLVSEWTYFRCSFGGGELEVECPGIVKGVLVGLITEDAISTRGVSRSPVGPVRLWRSPEGASGRRIQRGVQLSNVP